MTIQELNLLKTQAADILRTGVCFIQEGKQLSEGVLKLSAALAARNAEIARLREALQHISNLLVCGPIADPGELCQTGYEMAEAALSQPASALAAQPQEDKA